MVHRSRCYSSTTSKSPGLAAAASYVKRALDAGEAVVYFTFSRPFSTIESQTAEYATVASQGRLWIIDCYSRLYLPEEERAHKSAKKSGSRAGKPHVLFADARNPSDVYNAYVTALRAATDRGSVALRAVYETLSDFIKIADLELVLHYLRRVVVLEERRKIRALYMVWHDAIQGSLDQRYLQWFFSTTITMTKKAGPVPAINFQFDRFFPERVHIMTSTSLDDEQERWFRVDIERVAAIASTIGPLQFTPRAYGFLPALRADPNYPMHLANFLFYMVAIDHDTHRSYARYEDIFNGKVIHGSDLLYRQAAIAKEKNKDLFLADSFKTIDEEALREMFQTPTGNLPADIEGRADIFRECARLLIEHYKGDVVELLNESNQQLDGESGLFTRLRAFSAYADSIGKKSHLLVKVLRREALFAPIDTQPIRASIDHVIMTMALRSGMLICEDADELKSLQAGTQLDVHKVEVLRALTAKAVSALARAAGRPEDEIDDLLWSYGRKSLRLPTPLKVEDVRSELDEALNASALGAFVTAINGVGLTSSTIPTIRVPFTRFY